MNGVENQTRRPAPPPRPRHQLRPLPASMPAQPRPGTMTTAVRLWAFAAVAGAVGVTLIMLDLDQVRSELVAEVTREFPNEAPVVRDRAAVAALAILVGSRVLVEALQWGAVLAVRSRRRWARPVLVPLWLFGVVHCAFSAGRLPPPALVGLVTASALASAAVVAMFLPAANAWLSGRAAGLSRGGRP